MSKFDNVITDLKWLVSIGQRARTSDVAELHQAIRVLELASKVDPSACWFRSVADANDSITREQAQRVQELLDAISGKERK